MKVSAPTNSLHAAFTMVSKGLGLMIVPRHCVDASGLKNKIKIHETGKRSSMNTIYIVSLKVGVKLKRVQVAIDAFIESKTRKLLEK